MLSHKDPATGETVRTFHAIEANTQRQAERARDALILELERKGGAVASAMTLREFMDAFLRYKAASGTIEPSTVRSYRGESSQLCRYLGNVPVASLTVADVDGWMQEMSADGYAPKSVAKPFRLLKQALKWGQAQDLVAKNVCEFCKPPKRVKTPINALCRQERTRMLALAVRAQPEPLGLAVELALTTGMRRGEVCALRWSDLGDDGTITVSHALGNGPGGFYLKEPKTGSSARTIPLTRYTYDVLRAVRADSLRMAAEFGLGFADAYILGTQEPESRPYNPTMLGKDFAAFAKMNGFECTFHDLRHTFATMMIGNGCDVRTVASYLGHASVSMTLDIYADVDPEAKRAAVSKVEESFDAEMSGHGDAIMDSAIGAPRRREPALSFSVDQLLGANAQIAAPAAAGATAAPVPGVTFTVEQLEAMLAAAKRSEAANA